MKTKTFVIILSALLLSIVLIFEYVKESTRQSQKSELSQFQKQVTQVAEQRQKQATEIINTVKEINEQNDKGNERTVEHQRILDKASHKLAQKGFYEAELLGVSDEGVCVSVTKEGKIHIMKIRFTSCGGAIIDDAVSKERVLSF
ncbi:MAG: hypothetical protein WC229_00765 [Candidatus Paceibacterota bacterium]|jgi:hypothetical protein